MTAAADRHLLFGLLALQTGIISPEQLVLAFQAWTRDKSKSLADHLKARGDLDDDDRAAVEALAARHLKRNDGDVEKSLAAVPANRSTRASLADSANRRSRPRSPGSHGTRTATPPRLTMTTTPTAPPATPAAGRPAKASGSACFGLMRGAGWARCSWLWTPSCTARWR
jgi:hypothetical protein